MTPAPMNSMSKNKQPKAEAMKKREDRSKMMVKDVPSTTSGIFQNSYVHVTYIKAATKFIYPQYFTKYTTTSFQINKNNIFIIK